MRFRCNTYLKSKQKRKIRFRFWMLWVIVALDTRSTKVAETYQTLSWVQYHIVRVLRGTLLGQLSKGQADRNKYWSSSTTFHGIIFDTHFSATKRPTGQSSIWYYSNIFCTFLWRYPRSRFAKVYVLCCPSANLFSPARARASRSDIWNDVGGWQTQFCSPNT